MANRVTSGFLPTAIILLFQVVLSEIIWILKLETVRLQVEVPEIQHSELQDPGMILNTREGLLFLKEPKVLKKPLF